VGFLMENIMDLHGTRNRETDTAPKATTTVNMSIIGLVGTAPDAIAGVTASIIIGNTLMNNAIVFTATTMGFAGNQLRVTAVPGTPDITDPDNPAASDTTATYANKLLTITLGTDATGIVIATAAEVVAAVALVTASEITAELYPGITGAGIVDPFAATALQGGQDEPFPLYTPTLISGSYTQAAKLGTAGSLPLDISDIFAQTAALIVIVRVEEDVDATEQHTNIIQGILALEMAQGSLNYKPRVIIAPEWSTDDGIGKQLESTASKLRGVTYLDSVTMAPPDVVVRRAQKYGPRVEMLRPRIMVTDKVTGALVSRPYSAAAAGHRMRIDAEFGVYWSKSNHVVQGFSALEQVDLFILGEELDVVNQLNQANVNTIVMLDGFRHWGNRLCSSDPQFRFEAVRRTADMLQDSIQIMVTKNYIDRPGDKANGIAMVGAIDSYLRQEATRGTIISGRAWLDTELNTPESLAAGKVYVNVAYRLKSPMEEITVTYAIDTTTGATEELKAAA
jgi:phage tail sheath protein FI